MSRLSLPTVTLCAAASVNVEASVEALRASMEQVEFARCLLFTDAAVEPTAGIEIVAINRLSSGAAYSNFLLKDLAAHIRTAHCLIVQWDGFVIDARQWSPDFLAYDYIGARWPQFTDGRDVGNGGFSLRSRRLLEACSHPKFKTRHPEDVAICHDNRDLLEGELGMVFAPAEVADRFAFERASVAGPTFGFHGVFNMIAAVGADRFWKTYRALDDPRTAFVDYWQLVRQLAQAPKRWRRIARLTVDRIRGASPK